MTREIVPNRTDLEALPAVEFYRKTDSDALFARFPNDVHSDFMILSNVEQRVATSEGALVAGAIERILKETRLPQFPLPFFVGLHVMRAFRKYLKDGSTGNT